MAVFYFKFRLITTQIEASINTFKNASIYTTGVGFEPQNEPQNEPQKAELQQSIIELIKSNPKITRKEMSALLGKSMSTIFRILKINPHIKYIGSSKNGHWEIAEDKKDD